MRAFPIFCPACDSLILDMDICPDCGWQRPNDLAEPGRLVPGAIQLPAAPVLWSQAVADRGRLWFSGQRDWDAAGVLQSYERWRGACEVRYQLPGSAVAKDICGAEGMLLVSCGDAQIMPAQGKPYLALDSQTGSVLWERQLPGAFTLSPSSTNGRVGVFVSDENGLYAVNLADGAPIWPPAKVTTNTLFRPVVNETVVVASSGGVMQGGSELVGVEVASSRLLWRVKVESPLMKPMVASETAVYAPLASGLVALDVMTGRPMWKAPYRPKRITSRTGALTSPAVLAGRLIVFGCGSQKDGEQGYAIDAVDSETGQLAWSYWLPFRVSSRPSAEGSLVLCVTDTKVLLALELSSGRMIWPYTLANLPATGPVVVDDYAYVALRDGAVQAVRVKPRAERPDQPPAQYEAVGRWYEAAVAHALRNDFSPAGYALLNSGDARRAIKLFSRVDDHAGVAKAYEALQDWQNAITIYERLRDATSVADVLAKAGRHREAAERYRAANAWSNAARQYQIACLWVEAADCLLAGGLEGELQELAKLPSVDDSLANWLTDSAHWRLAISIYLRQGHIRQAAQLYRKHGEARAAYDLYWQDRNWEQCRALAQEMQDRYAEAEVCVQQGQHIEAGRLFEELNEWELALANYDRGRQFDSSVRALAALGRFEEAAQRLLTLPDYEGAGQYYRRTAEQVRASAPDNTELFAGFLRKAAESLKMAGNTPEAKECLRRVAQTLAEPILSLADVRVDSALKVGHESRMDVEIANTGYGPACRVRLFAEGGGFSFKSKKPVGNIVDVLAAGQSTPISTGIAPAKPGSGVELKLSLEYEIIGGTGQSIGPFQAFLAVQAHDDRQPVSIHIGQFEYIGPGGVHAQDAVIVRPQYQADAGSDVPLSAGEAAPQHSGISSEQPDRFCSRCGQALSINGTCTNRQCSAYQVR